MGLILKIYVNTTDFINKATFLFQYVNGEIIKKNVNNDQSKFKQN